MIQVSMLYITCHYIYSVVYHCHSCVPSSCKHHIPPQSFPGLSLDEEVFADGKVTTFGQVIGVIVAENQPLAQRAAKAVRVTYEELPSIITIEVLDNSLITVLDSIPVPMLALP